MLRLIRKKYFSHEQLKFFLYKIQFNNLNLDYPNILTNQIDFCFPKLYFGSLIRTKTECINKQPFIDVN